MRTPLSSGTWIRFEDGEIYQITSTPIGEGGGSLIYPAIRVRKTVDGWQFDKTRYALKECFPYSTEYSFSRLPSGEIAAEHDNFESKSYLDTAKRMQLAEKNVTEEIYTSGFRLLPITNVSSRIELSLDEGCTFAPIQNTMTVMELLSDKGMALNRQIRESRRLAPIQAFRVTEQVLLALREVHRAGYLHLDIQDGNVFIKGALSDHSDLVTLIDFGCARKMQNDGKCAEIQDRAILSTFGFSAPEMQSENDGTLRLGVEADLYSVSYLLLYLLIGKKLTPAQLNIRREKEMLTRMELRQMKCPEHLVGRMKSILQRGLALTPADRYHSTDEMLEAVSDFEKALQPYRSDLASIDYDAFICYRHGDLDTAAAQRIQSNLEHFRLPALSRGEITGKKKINRVFLDQGELSSCADFENEINCALDNAGWLIVMCSKTTKDSPWVGKEINRFLEKHDRSRLLAVLLEGEPQEVFPPQLLVGGEVLAADARGESKKTILKKLSGDVLLDIAAPILGVPFESLKQRRKLHRMKQLMTASILAVALAVSFSIYAIHQNHRINTQLESTLINQSRYLAQLSGELLSEGDRTAAIQVAMEALPKSESDHSRPFVNEAYYALNNAAYTYQIMYHTDFVPKGSIHAEGIVRTDEWQFSPNSQQFMMCNTSGQILLCDVEKQEQTKEFFPRELYPEATQTRFICGEYITDERLLLMTASEAICWNQISNQVEWVWTYEFEWTEPYFGESIQKNGTLYSNEVVAISQDGTYATFGFFNVLVFVDLSTGKVEKQILLDADEISTSSDYISSVALSEDGKQAAVVIGSFALTDILCLVDTQTGALHVCKSPLPNIIHLNFYGKDRLAVFCVAENSLTSYHSTSSTCILFCVNTLQGKMIWDHKFDFRSDDYPLRARLSVSKSDTLAATVGNRLELLNMEDGSKIDTISASCDILSLMSEDENYLFLLCADGSLSQYSFSNGSYRKVGGLTGAFTSAKYLMKNQEFYLLKENSAEVIILSNQMSDPDFQPLDIEATSLSSIRFETTDGKDYCILTSSSGYNSQTISVWDASRLEMLGSTDNIAEKEYISLIEQDGSLVLYYFQIFGGYKEICSYNLHEQKKTVHASLPQLNQPTLIYMYHQLLAVNPETGETQIFSPPCEGTSILNAILSPDGKYCVVQVMQNWDESVIKQLNLSDGMWSDIECLKDTVWNQDEGHLLQDSISFSPTGQLITPIDGYLSMIDCETGEVVQMTSLACKEACSYDFLDDDTLIFWGDSRRLTIWSIPEARILSESELLERDVVTIMTDSERRILVQTKEDFYVYQSLYCVNQDESLSKLLEVRNGFIDIQRQRVLCADMSKRQIGFFNLLTLDELIEKANKTISWKTLSDSDKSRYFIQ